MWGFGFEGSGLQVPRLVRVGDKRADTNTTKQARHPKASPTRINGARPNPNPTDDSINMRIHIDSSMAEQIDRCIELQAFLW